jgi:hypothetical protein
MQHILAAKTEATSYVKTSQLSSLNHGIDCFPTGETEEFGYMTSRKYVWEIVNSDHGYSPDR